MTETTIKVNGLDVPLSAVREAMVAAGAPRSAAEKWTPLPARTAVERDGERSFRIDGVILSPDDERFEAWLFGEVLGVGPAAIAEFLADAGGEDVVLVINSPGGAVYGGADICSQIQLYPGKVTARVVGEAASCGSLIAAACDAVEVAPMAMVMIHAPWARMAGNANELRAEAEVLDKHSANFLEVYATRMDRDKVKGWLASGEDHWLTSAEALSEKFADAKIETKKGGGATDDPDAASGDGRGDPVTPPSATPPITITGGASADPEPTNPPAGQDATGSGADGAGDPPGDRDRSGATDPCLGLSLLLAATQKRPRQESGDGTNIR